MKLKIIEENSRKMTFTLSDANSSFANSLRRIMMSEVPVMSIDAVYFENNSTGLYDEVISHRLGLIPLSFDPKVYNIKEECSCKGKGCSKCQAVLSFDSAKAKLIPDEGFMLVRSGDLISDDKEVKPVSDDVPIVEMLPDHALKFDAVARLGTGKIHAKWQASNVGYTLMPSVKISGQKCESCKCCIENCPKGVFEEKSGKVIVTHEDRCSLCMRCVDLCNTGAVTVKGDETSFIFTVESVSGLSPKQILEKALEILEEKVKEFVKEVK